MTFIVARRSEIQNGSVQITDLFPNQSQANLVNDPKPQGPYYVRVPVFGTEFGRIPTLRDTNNAISFNGVGVGLVSYLLVHIENKLNGQAITVVQAIDCANEIISKVRNGNKMEADDLNKVIQGNVNAQSDFDGSTPTNSTGEVSHVLRILSGESYSVPKGTAIQDAQSVYIPVVGDSNFKNDIRVLVENDRSWKTSFDEGVLKGLTTVQDAVKGDLFAGVRSTSPLLTVYKNDGTLYVG